MACQASIVGLLLLYVAGHQYPRYADLQVVQRGEGRREEPASHRKDRARRDSGRRHPAVRGGPRCGTVCCHRCLLFMAIVEDAFPSRSDGSKQPLSPYRGSYAASEADHEYRHLISHRVLHDAWSRPRCISPE